MMELDLTDWTDMAAPNIKTPCHGAPLIVLTEHQGHDAGERPSEIMCGADGCSNTWDARGNSTFWDERSPRLSEVMRATPVREDISRAHNAEVVARYFRDRYDVLVRNGEPEFRDAVHALDRVLDALGGTTDPEALEMDPDSLEALNLEV